MSFQLMWDRGLTDALTSDHHFEQAGFRILLKYLDVCALLSSWA
jgi:predicted nucleic acid-binding protein